MDDAEFSVMSSGLQRRLRQVGLVMGIAITLTMAWAGYLRLTGNFHTVEQGIIYRSGQLSGSQLQARITENGIRTVINFRGNNTGRPWYDDEIKASALTGAQHIDFPLSSGKELTDDQLIKLTSLLRDSPRPVLIHCEAGADRSGLAAALYKLVVAKSAPEESRAQLSFRYGHFPWLRNSTAAMDRTFERVLTRTRSTQIAK
jgi:protein tyrosine/serine phosphatase